MLRFLAARSKLAVVMRDGLYRGSTQKCAVWSFCHGINKAFAAIAASSDASRSGERSAAKWADRRLATSCECATKSTPKVEHSAFPAKDAGLEQVCLERGLCTATFCRAVRDPAP